MLPEDQFRCVSLLPSSSLHDIRIPTDQEGSGWPNSSVKPRLFSLPARSPPLLVKGPRPLGTNLIRRSSGPHSLHHRRKILFAFGDSPVNFKFPSSGIPWSCCCRVCELFLMPSESEVDSNSIIDSHPKPRRLWHEEVRACGDDALCDGGDFYPLAHMHREHCSVRCKEA